MKNKKVKKIYEILKLRYWETFIGMKSIIEYDVY